MALDRQRVNPSPHQDDAGRATYRHGDLGNALVDAGLVLARSGGPDAVVLREATRRAGVAPNAAYRHFASRDALLSAVSVRCLAQVAAAMTEEVASAPAADPAAELDAVGRAYVHFALREPGWFATAFTVSTGPEQGRGGEDGVPGPYGLLGSALDHAVEAGLLPAERRPGAEVLAWSAVHGLAVLLLDGPLRAAPARDRERMLAGVLAMAREGLFR